MPPPPATFSKITYKSEPFKPPITIVTHGDSTSGIRQMNGAKGIKTNFNRLFEGEDPPIRKGECKKKFIKEIKFLTSDGFRYTSPAKESNNRGDYTATFTKVLEHIPVTAPETEERSDIGLQKSRPKGGLPAKNVMTNPYMAEVFNKIPYITPSVDKMPGENNNKTTRVVPFTFTKKNDTFQKLTYVPESSILRKSKSESAVEKVKTPTVNGHFRHSSPLINSKAAVAGAFHQLKYESTPYDDHVRRKAPLLDKLHPLPPRVKNWL